MRRCRSIQCKAVLCELGTRHRYETLVKVLLWLDIAAQACSRTLVVRR